MCCSSLNMDINPGVDGLYAIFCYNYKENDEGEIRKYFKRYGKIVSIRTSGKNGTCIFIRYRKFEEARRCIEDQCYSRDYGKPRMARTPKECLGKEHLNQNSLPCGNIANGEQAASASNHFQYKDDDTDNIAHEKGYASSSPSSSENVFQGGRLEDDKPPPLVSALDNLSCGRLEDDKPPPLVSALDNLSCGRLEDDKPPPLVSALDNLSFQESEQYLEDIVIANFPFGTKQLDMLGLCDSLNPIHISEFRTTKILKIPYCHIYFESPNGYILESRLHGRYFHGKRLIVKQVEKLLEIESS